MPLERAAPRGRARGARRARAAHGDRPRLRAAAQLLGALLARHRRRPGSPASTSRPARCSTPRAGCGWTRWASGRPTGSSLFQGALTYEDPRFAGYDAAVLMEVDRARRPAAAAGAGARRVRRRRDRRGGGHHAQRRLQRPLRGARRHAPPRPPLRVDPGRVRRLVRAGRRDARLHRRAARGRRASIPSCGTPTQLAVFRRG